MKRIHVFVCNTIFLIISSLVLRSIGMAFGVFISNRVGSEALGIFQLVMSVYLFMVTLASSGINLACTRIVSEKLAVGDYLGSKKAAKQCICISLCTGLLASFVLFTCSDFIVNHFLHGRISSSILYIICLALPAIAMSSAINGYFTAVRRVYKTSSTQFFEQLVKIACTALLISRFLPSGLEYACFCLILGDVISEIASFVLSYLLYLWDVRKVRAGTRPTPTRYEENFEYFYSCCCYLIYSLSGFLL